MRPRQRQGSRGLLAILLLISLSALLVDLRSESGAYAGLRTGVGTLVGPFQGGARWALGPENGTRAIAASDEAAALQQQIDRLQRQSQAAEAQLRRLADLEQLLDLAPTTGQQGVAADVVAYDAGTPTTITIGKGSRDGIEVDSGVLGPAGLVGRTTGVGPWSSTITLLSSPSSTVGVRVAQSGEVGTVSGRGNAGSLRLELLDPTVELEVGQRVVSFGSLQSRPFPADLPIGTVTSVDRSGVGRVAAEVAPFGDLTALSTVMVLDGDAATGEEEQSP